MVPVARLWLVAFVCLLGLAHAAAAGSAALPEITDDQNDQAVTVNGVPSPAPTCGPAGQPTTCVYIPADIWTAWVEEAGGNLTLSINLAQAPPSTFGVMTYSFSLTANGTIYVASATVNQASPAGDGAVTPGGIASSADVSGTVVVLTVAKTAIPFALPGTNLTHLFVTSSGTGASSGQQDVSDRGPSTGYGTDFRMRSSAPAKNPPSNATSSSGPNSSAPQSSSGSTGPHTDVQCTSAGAVVRSCPAASSTTAGKKTPIDLPAAVVAITAAAMLARLPRRANR